MRETRPLVRYNTCRWMAALALVLPTMLAQLMPAAAHPHIWVNVRTTVLYANGTIVGFRHAWSFDEYYTAMAIDGLDVDKDGKYTREELAELAKVNVEALKEFGYFTFPRLKEQPLPVSAPTEFYLEHAPRPAGQPAAVKPAGEAVLPRSGADKIAEAAAKPAHELTLHFTLPLAKPVLAEAEGFDFSIGDPSFFIAFDLSSGTPITLSAAPAGCRLIATEAKPEQANPSKPGDLMAGQPSDLSISITSAPSWRITCAPAG